MGDAKVGSTLTASVTPEGASVDYRWSKADTANGDYSDIARATGKTHVCTAEEEGKFLKCTANGKESYSGTSISDSIGPVTAAE